MGSTPTAAHGSHCVCGMRSRGNTSRDTSRGAGCISAASRPWSARAASSTPWRADAVSGREGRAPAAARDRLVPGRPALVAARAGSGQGALPALLRGGFYLGIRRCTASWARHRRTGAGRASLGAPGWLCRVAGRRQPVALGGPSRRWLTSAVEILRPAQGSGGGVPDRKAARGRPRYSAAARCLSVLYAAMCFRTLPF